MAVIPVNLAVEDELSGAVVLRLLAHANKEYVVGTTYGLRGYGYLRRTVHGWNRAAQGVPFVLVTDLDRYPCPSALIADWLTGQPHPNLIFRVAVREIEAWLLADRQSLAKHLAVPEAIVPTTPEGESDPKRSLISVARRSRSRTIRARIVPKVGSTSQQGPDYNACLIEFVTSG